MRRVWVRLTQIDKRNDKFEKTAGVNVEQMSDMLRFNYGENRQDKREWEK